MALHFVGFKDDRYWNAVRIFGLPDFYHRNWDMRAKQEIVEGDIAVFAVGSIYDEPKPISWDASKISWLGAARSSYEGHRPHKVWLTPLRHGDARE